MQQPSKDLSVKRLRVKGFRALCPPPEIPKLAFFETPSLETLLSTPKPYERQTLHLHPHDGDCWNREAVGMLEGRERLESAR